MSGPFCGGTFARFSDKAASTIETWPETMKFVRVSFAVDCCFRSGLAAKIVCNDLV